MNWKYLAGFFDGEGYVGLRRSGTARSFQPMVCITQKYPRVLRLIRDFLGFGYLNKVKTNYGTAYRLRFYQRAQVRSFLLKIQPLVIVKGRQVDLMLTVLKPRLTTNSKTAKAFTELKRLKRVG